MTKNKGDIWSLDINWFGPPSTCVLPTDISRMSIVATNNDGWNIQSISTAAVFTNGLVKFMTMDYDAYKWVNGDGSSADRSFDLRPVAQGVSETGMYINNQARIMWYSFPPPCRQPANYYSGPMRP